MHVLRLEQNIDKITREQFEISGNNQAGNLLHIRLRFYVRFYLIQLILNENEAMKVLEITGIAYGDGNFTVT